MLERSWGEQTKGRGKGKIEERREIVSAAQGIGEQGSVGGGRDGLKNGILLRWKAPLEETEQTGWRSKAEPSESLRAEVGRRNESHCPEEGVYPSLHCIAG